MAALVGQDRGADRASNDTDVSSTLFIPTVRLPQYGLDGIADDAFPARQSALVCSRHSLPIGRFAIALRVFRGRYVRFDTPVLGQQAVTTQREVQNAFKSLFADTVADTDNANDLKNLYVNRLLQHILQAFERL